MEWLNNWVTNANDLAKSVFSLICIVIAIKNMAQSKLLAIVLFVVAAALLGWVVNDNTNAIATLQTIFSTVKSAK